MTSTTPVPGSPAGARRIGRVGTAAHVLVGMTFIAVAFEIGPVGIADLATRLVVPPVLTVLVLRVRRADASPLRWTGPSGHLANIAIAVALRGPRDRRAT